jgi:hypothetical protein
VRLQRETEACSKLWLVIEDVPGEVPGQEIEATF